MEFIVTDGELHEQGYLQNFDSLDFDLADRLDFELVTNEILGFGQYIIMPGTEWGGIVQRITRSTDTQKVIYTGISFRGLLDQDIITPPSGQDYRTISGDANAILATILPEGNGAATLFNVPSESAGVTFTNYKFERYRSKLYSLAKMLKTKDMKLRIWAQENDPGDPVSVWCEAVPIIDYTDRLKYSQDYGIRLTIDDDRGGINHMICLGQGDLAARQRIDLYVQQDGSISTAGAYYTGIDMRTSVYNYSSVESLDDLQKSGIEKLEELSNRRELDMDVGEFEADIGDIVAAQDGVTGISLSKPVTGKILRIQDHSEKIEIIVKGGTDENGNY
ncbi:MAG: siphovirus ReqiPepy6 Gp37-like family protein [Clostridiales Family XIII bacterium]|jgi:hypothetical protein|nr:siphovirus ReqiPepy6 Gp37-like family protein [Clostridiales Family XIII bacterium]